jgi:hypothetical protein
MLKSVRWAIIAMGIFATTAAFAVAQSGGIGRIVDSIRSNGTPEGAAADQGTSSAQSADDFLWTGRLSAGDALEIKGVNGSIRAGAATGSEVEVRAQARGRKSDPSSVGIVVVEHAGGVTVCAVYPSPEGERANSCEPGAGGRMNTRNNDVNVEFEVLLPAGVDFVARTVNGEVAALDLGGDVDATTVNGDVEISTTGFARAQTVNGDIDAAMGARDFSDGAAFETVNGSISLDVADDVNANLSAKWLNGGFESDIPFMLTGRMNRQSASGTLGDGGPQLDLRTVNGSIQIR